MDWRSTGNQTSDVVQWMVNDSNNNNSSPVGASQIVLDKFVSSSLHLMGANGGGTALNVATPTADLVTAEEMYRDPLSVLITVTVLYSVIFVVGLVGNIITCIVISRNKSMHTATNYYLFNLAITDMLMLVSAMPPDLYNAWNPWQYPFDSAICVLQGLLAETSTNVTILTISCFTIERYIAICHPFLQHSMSKLSRAVKFIIGIWIGALTAALPQACQFGVVTINNAVLCTVKNETISYAFEISSLIFFVSPMILICVLYVLIGLKLRQSSRLIAKFSHRSSRPSRGSSCSNNNINQAQGNGKTKDRPLTTSTSSPDVAYNQIAQQQSSTPKKSQRRIIKMLIAVVVAFFLCWAPFHAQRLLAVYGSTDDNTPKNHTFYIIYTVLTHISGVTFFLSTCINPLLYSVMSYKFRNAFKATIGGTCFKFDWKKRWSSRTTGGGSWKISTTTSSQKQQTENVVAMPPGPPICRKDIELRSIP